MTRPNMRLRWKPALTIRPNMIGDAQGVQVSDAIAQQRYKLSRVDLLEILKNSVDSKSEAGTKQITALTNIGLLAEAWPDLENYNEGIKHWEKHNWSLALSYYFWASRDKFLDEGENYEEIRCDALSKMLAESEVPLPELISEENAINLGETEPIPHLRSLGDVLKGRVTTQVMRSKGEMTKSVLHGLLHHGFSVSRKYHIPDVKEHIHNLLHGVGFAFDPFLAVFDVAGLEPGIYYYGISQDFLSLVKAGNFRQEVCTGLIGHQQALEAACTVFLVADFPRFQWRYRHERALRNLYVDVGRMAQYFILVATAFGVKNHLTPATVDDFLARLLDIDGEKQQVFYSITLGY